MIDDNIELIDLDPFTWRNFNLGAIIFPYCERDEYPQDVLSILHDKGKVLDIYNPKNIKENLKEVGEYIERLTDKRDYFYKYLVKIREQLSSLLECCV